MKQYLLGYDIGTSSIKASLVEVSGLGRAASEYWPKEEAPIISQKPGWAEQEPQMWWDNLKAATRELFSKVEDPLAAKNIAAIGITYQMHGLVCLDKDRNVLRPSIIWCDSRAVPYGNAAFEKIGADTCLDRLLGSPGNFTAAKLAWVKENEGAIFEKIDKIMLPGDYIAMKLSGEACTTVCGLSEGMMWDFKDNAPACFLLDYFGFGKDILPRIVPVFAEQGRLQKDAAAELGLPEGIPITYRSGDQPNNALSLGVVEPGEVASTAGTSGVVYGVCDSMKADPLSRVNLFAHVNHSAEKTRLGMLLCINGTGILNSWVRRNVCPEGMSYKDMNVLGSEAPIGCGGMGILPFGNGAERVLSNRETGCSFFGVDFNRHDRRHILRAVNEGIAFSFKYGMDIMHSLGMKVEKIHAGKANMFLNPVFRNTLAGVTGAGIELYDTDGSVGAAIGAGIGKGIFKDAKEAFSLIRKTDIIEPSSDRRYLEAYSRWKEELDKHLKQ